MLRIIEMRVCIIVCARRYIVKPLSAGEGIGIKLLNGLSATAPYATVAPSHVIQPYVSLLKTTIAEVAQKQLQFIAIYISGDVWGRSVINCACAGTFQIHS